MMYQEIIWLNEIIRNLKVLICAVKKRITHITI
jgi:hypothetical protein